MDKLFIKIGKVIFYPLVIIGCVDFALQIFTAYEFKLVHRILAAIFN